MYIDDLMGDVMLWNALNAKPNFVTPCIEHCFEKNDQIHPNIHICHSIDSVVCGALEIAALHGWHGEPWPTTFEVEGQGKKNNGYSFF